MHTLLTEHYQFDPDHAVLLSDEDATRSKILQAMRDVLSKATDQDTVLFYFAGQP